MIKLPSGKILYYTGPDLSAGPLPAFFYFALSGDKSLHLDPYNQPIVALKDSKIRTFSLTLPGHENDPTPDEALAHWAKNPNAKEEFLSYVKEALHYCTTHNLLDPHKMAIGGLSRGAFAASLVASVEHRFQYLLLFAPLTRFHDEDLLKVTPFLKDRHVRLFIGNDDLRVGTRQAVDFALSLVEHKTTRSADVEVLIYESIGRSGHGTPPHIFQQGASWLLRHLQ